MVHFVIRFDVNTGPPPSCEARRSEALAAIEGLLMVESSAGSEFGRIDFATVLFVGTRRTRRVDGKGVTL